MVIGIYLEQVFPPQCAQGAIDKDCRSDGFIIDCVILQCTLNTTNDQWLLGAGKMIFLGVSMRAVLIFIAKK